MNAIKELMKHFSLKEQKILKEEYSTSFKQRGDKHIARSIMFQKAYKLKKEVEEKKIREITEDYIPENYVDYGKYRIVLGKAPGALFNGTMNECIHNKKYGYTIYKVLCENEIDVYDGIISIMGVK
jgi:hypothetical protein